MAAAVQFNETFASKYVAAPTAAPMGSWVTVSGIFTGKLAVKQPTGDAQHRLFVLSVPYDPVVDSYLVPGAQIRFPIVPGAEENSVVCSLPAADKWPSSKCSFTFPVKLTKEGATADTVTINGMEVRSHPAADAVQEETPAPSGSADIPIRRPPVQSVQRTPIPVVEVHALLATLSYSLGGAARNGDCYLLSTFASVGGITPEEAANPTSETTEKVISTRNAAIDLIVGESVHGIDGSTFRSGEKLPADGEKGEEAMAAWREAGHWQIEGEEYKTPPFMFGVAVVVKRPVVVLERRGETYLNPVHIYGSLDADGNLVRTAARGGDKETIQSYQHIDFEVVLALLRSTTPPALIEFDGVNHHSPFLRAELAPTEVADLDVGNLTDVEEHNAEKEEPLLGRSDLEDKEMTATMDLLELAWGDVDQTTMIGTAKTYDLMNQVSIFLDNMEVNSVSVIIPGVRRFDFSRSEFGQHLLSYASMPDPPGEEEIGEDDGGGMMNGMAEEVEETPPESAPPALPMAPLRPTNIARPKSLTPVSTGEVAEVVVEPTADPTGEDGEVSVIADVQMAEAGAVSEAVEPPAKRARRTWQAAGNVTATRDESPGGGLWASYTVTLSPDERIVAGAQVRFVKSGVAAQMFDVPSLTGGQVMCFPLRFSDVAGDSVTVKMEVKAATHLAGKPLTAKVAPVATPIAVNATPPVATAPARKRKVRAAAVRANDTLSDVEAGDGEDLTHKTKATIVPVKELSLPEALPPGMSTIVEAPPEDLEGLFGRCVAYRWHGWGWACGRLAAPKDEDSNCTVQYKEWAEQQTLCIDAYGEGDYGTWLLLDETLAPPIDAYESGKYRIGGELKRAVQLPFHTAEELKEARDAAAEAKWAETEAAVQMELDTGDFSVGRRVFCRGQGGDGEQAWFVTQVVAHRNRFPPIQVRFLATHPDGDTSALALPVPRLVFVPATNVQVEEPAE